MSTLTAAKSTDQAPAVSRLGVVRLNLAIVVVVLLVWQAVPASWLPQYATARPSEISEAMWQLIASGELVAATLGTLRSIALGILLGAVGGVVVGLLLSIPAIGWVFGPSLDVLNAVPKVTLVPLFILAFGFSAQATTMFTAANILFVFLIHMRQGIKQVDPNRKQSLMLMGATPVKIARVLVLPSCTPYLYAALRMSVPLAFGAAIFAELRMAQGTGLGSLLQTYAVRLEPAAMFAVILVVGALGYVFDVIVGRALSSHAVKTGGQG